MSGQAILSVRWWHEQVVDLMLLFPFWKQGDIAIHLDVTEPWLSSVINSDVFKAYYQMRMKEHHAGITKGVTDRCEDLAINGLDAMNKKIKEAADSIPLPQIKESTEMALKAIGMGTKGVGNSNGAGVNILVTEGGQLTLEQAVLKLDKRKEVLNVPEPEAKETPEPEVLEGTLLEVVDGPKKEQMEFKV